MSRPHRVLVADRLSREGLTALKADARVEVVEAPGLLPQALREAAADADALLVRSGVKVDEPLLAAAKRLRVVGRAGIGVDNVDLTAATRRGVLVMNSPDANANTTAEHALALLFALARRIPAADRSVRAGRWERQAFVGKELLGKTLGVLGGGNIGRRVARKARALGLEVVVYDPFLRQDALADDRVEVVPLAELQRRADFVTVHVPRLPETDGLVDAAFFSRCKRGVLLVHCARGGIVDEAALLAALESGQAGGAALDVFADEPPPTDHPLFARDDVVLTPHLGASTTEAQERAAAEICAQVLDYLVRGTIVNAVNLPRVAPEALAELEPWLDLARRLGVLLRGLAQAPPETLTVTGNGALATQDLGLLSRAVLAGLLAKDDEAVNLVNAPAVAAERGVRLVEERDARVRDFAAALGAACEGGGSRVEVAGALFGLRQPRLVRIDAHRLDAVPEGVLLIVRNADRPGVVGRVGTALGDRGVNIRGMSLSPPAAAGGEALAVLNLSRHPGDAAVAALAALPDVRTAALLTLDDGGPTCPT